MIPSSPLLGRESPKFPLYCARISLTTAAVLLGAGLAAQQEPAVGQKPALRQKPATRRVQSAKTAPVKTNPAVGQLQTAISDARTAQLTGKPESVVHASQRVIGLALRSLAGVKSSEGGWTEAAELYRQSLDFDDNGDAHADVAIAYMHSGRPDDALREAAKAVAANPQSSRAWHVQGKAMMLKRDYANAVQSLGRAVCLRSDLEAAYSLGVCFLELHEKAKAAAVFQQMTEVAGNRGIFHGLFGRAYQEEGLFEEAKQEYKKAAALDPKIPHIHYFLGLVDTIINSWVPTPLARREFLLEAQQYPTDFFGNYFTGYIAATDKRYEESDHYLRIAAGAQPSSPEVWMVLGLNARDQGRNEEAEKLLRKAIELTGKDEARNRYQIRRAYFALGRLLMATSRREEGAALVHRSGELQALSLAASQQSVATRVLRSAAEGGMGGAGMVEVPGETPAMGNGDGEDSMDRSDETLDRPSLAPAQLEQAKSREQQLQAILGAAFNDLATAEARQQRYQLALTHYQQAERWDPNTPLLMRNLGLAATHTQDYPEAVRALRKSLDAQPEDNLVRCMLGISLFTVQEYPEAAKVFGGAGDAVFSQPGLAYAYASSLSKTHKVQEAGKILDQLELKPLTPDMLLLVGQVWSDMADYPHAIGTFHKALQQNPTLLKAHYYAGLASMRSDKPQDAEGEFRAELALDPTDISSKYDLAYALLQLQKNAEAGHLLTEVVNAKPEHADAHYRLGRLLLEEGRIKDAIQHLEAAARLNPDLDYVHYQLQSAYRKDGRLADADAELKLYREIKAHNRQGTLPVPEQNNP